VYGIRILYHLLPQAESVPPQIKTVPPHSNRAQVDAEPVEVKSNRAETVRLCANKFSLHESCIFFSLKKGYKFHGDAHRFHSLFLFAVDDDIVGQCHVGVI